MEHVQKLRNIDSEEKTEEALLRSRIDQQSELICILKRRADEYLEKYVQNEKDLAKLQKEFDNCQNLLTVERDTHSSLKLRFNKLNESCEEVMKLKEELEIKNAMLSKECLLLKDENQQLFTSSNDRKDVTIKSLQEEVRLKQDTIEELEKNDRVNTDAFNLELEKVQSELSAVKDKTEVEKDELREEMERVKKDLVETKQQLAMMQQREQSIDEQIEQLQNDLKDKKGQLSMMKAMYANEQKRSKELEEKFMMESENVSKSGKVKGLQMRVAELEDEHHKLVLHFDAYKKHTGELLKKEKDLNAKLRCLKSAGATRSRHNHVLFD